MSHRKKILVAPLNWGLGHASRCIPVIRELLRQEAEVLIASDGGSLQLLRREFPNLCCFELPAWDVNYEGQNLTRSLLRQSAKLLRAIAQEHAATENLVREHQIDAVISDNRFGCRSEHAFSVIMSHQVSLLTPHRLLDIPANAANQLWLDRFEEVWIPDFEGETNLAGDLSRNPKLHKAVYIGPLSRMLAQVVEKKFDAVVVLSGPEPKRTEFEHLLFRQAIHLTGKQFLVVRGQTERWEMSNLTPHIELVSYLTSRPLNEAILSGKVLIARSGYSTVMDLYHLGHPAILVPTPGQTEQEYLASRFQERGVFYSQTQDAFQLAEALDACQQYPGLRKQDFPGSTLSGVVAAFLQKI